MILTFSPSSILYQLPRIAGGVPRICDEMGAVIDHVPVGPHNCNAPRDRLLVRRIEQAVILIRLPHLALSRVVGKQQRQPHIWMYLFCLTDGAGSHRVKSAIMAYYIVCHAIRLYVPQHGIMITLGCLLIGVILNYLIPDSKLFLYIYSASVFPGMMAWFVLAYSQKNFRRRWGEKAMAAHPFKSPLFPYANYFCLIFLVLVTIGMWINPDTRMSLIAGWIFIAIVTIGYFLAGYRKNEYNEDGTLKAKH